MNMRTALIVCLAAIALSLASSIYRPREQPPVEYITPRQKLAVGPTSVSYLDGLVLEMQRGRTKQTVQLHPNYPTIFTMAGKWYDTRVLSDSIRVTCLDCLQ